MNIYFTVHHGSGCPPSRNNYFRSPSCATRTFTPDVEFNTGSGTRCPFCPECFTSPRSYVKHSSTPRDQAKHYTTPRDLVRHHPTPRTNDDSTGQAHTDSLFRSLGWTLPINATSDTQYPDKYLSGSVSAPQTGRQIVVREEDRLLPQRPKTVQHLMERYTDYIKRPKTCYKLSRFSEENLGKIILK